MLLGVFLRCVVVVLGGVQHVTMSDFGMVRGLLVIAGLGVLGGLAMMLRGMIVVFRGLVMMVVDVMFVNIVTVHCYLPDSRHRRMRETSSGSMN